MVDLTQYTHILWDWNGTLLDDAWLCLEIINTFLAERGLPVVSMDRYRSVFTFPVRDYYEALGFDFSRESWEKVSTGFITAYEQNRSKCRLMPGTAPALRRVSSLGMSQSILSASKQEYLKKAVREYEVDGFFCAVNGLDNHHAAGKVAIGKAFIDRHGLLPSEILLIGDTLHDVEVANAIGADCCLVPNGHQTLQRLAGSGALIVESLAVFAAETASKHVK